MCSHSHVSWHMACLNHCFAHTHTLHTLWERPRNTGFLILTPAVLRSRWPPQSDLWLSIFAPCTAGDYNGTLFFLTCHWQSAITLGHVILLAGQCVNNLSLLRYGFVGRWLQCPCNTSTETNVQWYGKIQEFKVGVIFTVFFLWTNKHAEKYLNNNLGCKSVMLHFHIILMYFALLVTLS